MKKKVINSLFCFLMCLAMLLEATPTITGGIKAYASTNSEPSIIYWADKEQLMNFSTGADGRGKVGKIKLGMKDIYRPLPGETTEALEWWVMGKDDGVANEENTVIYAADAIKREVMFEREVADISQEEIEYTDGYGDYPEGIIPQSVYVNHYGASNVRKVLNELINDYDYLMDVSEYLQSTTVTTLDTKNNIEYTTSDILYNLRLGDDGLIYAGSDVSPKAWDSEKNLYYTGVNWLRTPVEGQPRVTYAELVGNTVVSGWLVFNTWGARPASNLDLSKVIFASAATSAYWSEPVICESVRDNAAMTLRINPIEYGIDGTASEINLGTATYNDESITVIPGRTDFGSALVVQGKTDGKDWYYSKYIDMPLPDPETGEVINEPQIITKEDILNELKHDIRNNFDDIDLYDCKIWLEMQANVTGTISYAKLATAVESRKTVSYASSSNASIKGDSSEKVVYGKSPKNVPDYVANTGYTFKGYSADKDVRLTDDGLIAASTTMSKEEVEKIKVTEDITLSPVLEKNKQDDDHDKDNDDDNDDDIETMNITAVIKWNSKYGVVDSRKPWESDITLKLSCKIEDGNWEELETATVNSATDWNVKWTKPKYTKHESNEEIASTSNAAQDASYDVATVSNATESNADEYDLYDEDGNILDGIVAQKVSSLSKLEYKVEQVDFTYSDYDIITSVDKTDDNNIHYTITNTYTKNKSKNSSSGGSSSGDSSNKKVVINSSTGQEEVSSAKELYGINQGDEITANKILTGLPKTGEDTSCNIMIIIIFSFLVISIYMLNKSKNIN